MCAKSWSFTAARAFSAEDNTAGTHILCTGRELPQRLGVVFCCDRRGRPSPLSSVPA